MCANHTTLGGQAGDVRVLTSRCQLIPCAACLARRVLYTSPAGAAAHHTTAYRTTHCKAAAAGMDCTVRRGRHSSGHTPMPFNTRLPPTPNAHDTRPLDGTTHARHQATPAARRLATSHASRSRRAAPRASSSPRVVGSAHSLLKQTLALQMLEVPYRQRHLSCVRSRHSTTGAVDEKVDSVETNTAPCADINLDTARGCLHAHPNSLQLQLHTTRSPYAFS